MKRNYWLFHDWIGKRVKYVGYLSSMGLFPNSEAVVKRVMIYPSGPVFILLEIEWDSGGVSSLLPNSLELI
jgi:hypothetical protein